MGIKLSACTIVKNEELNIGKSIDSYKDFVDEIIIVDTGSIDKTKEIAESKGATVFEYEWKNDFAAAKNFALDKASGDWIVFLDADEWFDGDCAKNIKKAIEDAQNQNYSAVASKLINFYTEKEILETGMTIRIFKHSDNIRFDRAIHEALFDLSKNIALPGIFNENLVINHSGYMKDLVQKKAKRNKMLLDKHFASGKFSPIDYFYGMRENLTENINISEYFYKLIENTPNYDELVSTFNVSTSIDETKFKVVNALAEKYSFNYRVKLLQEIQNKYSNVPIFKFYEYLLFEKVDKKRAIQALQASIDLDENFGEAKEVRNNSFYSKKSEAYRILGEYNIFINDKLKALDCFTKSLGIDNKNVEALMGLLYTIANEKTEDIISFINSLFDISNKEIEQFLIDALRLTRFKEVFLYYFVDYYKKYNEVNLSFFTSRLLTENFEEIIDKYIQVYKESKDEHAIMLIASALIAGNCKKKFESIIENITPLYFNILNAYFNEQDITIASEKDFVALLSIFKEIAYIADDDTIEKLANISSSFEERVKFEIIKYYYFEYSYEYVLKWIDKFIDKEDLKNNLCIYANYLKTNIYFRNNDFENIVECLDKVVYSGYLDEDIILICQMLEADDEKLQEYFELFDSLSFLRLNNMCNDIQDINNDIIKFMTIENFKEEISNKSILLIEENTKLFFDFAEKLKEKRIFIRAEKYYKLALKYGYRVDMCYYALGKIYNILKKPELSYYCYENAFIENLTLAQSLLPKEHKNYNYVFTKKSETNIKVCPICGGKANHISTYVNIEDENLTYNDPVIAKYSCCSKCKHVFLNNDIIDKQDFYKLKRKDNIDDNRIMLSYDILENICEITDGMNILDYSEDNGEFRTAAINYGFCVENDISDKLFDVIFAGNKFNNEENIEKLLGVYNENLADDGVIVFHIYDEGNAFSKLLDKPLWSKAGIKNIFSRKSVETLLNKARLQILQINIDKMEKGKTIVYAIKM